MFHILLLSLLLIKFTYSIPLNLCSSVNIGSFEENTQFMSTGECRKQCTGKGYIVAIVNQHDCYCSNNVPEDTTDLSNCNTGCPGIDTEQCGGNGYYGYLLFGNPSATVGNDETSTTSTESSSTNQQTISSQTTTSQTTSSSSTSSSTSTSSTTTSSTTTSSTRSSTSTSSTQSSSPTISATPPTTLITRTTQVTQTHRSSDIVQVTEYTTEIVQASTSSSSSSSSSTTPPSVLISTTIEPSTVYSIMTVNGTQTQEVRTMYITRLPSSTQTSNSSIITSSSSSLSSSTPIPASSSSSTSSVSSKADDSDSSSSSIPTSNSNKDAFFDDKGKVAGTFTAVGIVVLGLVSGILYCCCCCSTSNNDHDSFTDEENHYSSDELDTINREKVIIANNNSKNSSLKRNNSSKNSLFTYFNKDPSDTGINRSQSRKKLMKRENSVIHNDEIMFPINETDSRLDPDTMFLNTNSSYKSFGDDHDYSRTLKITNPDDK
ncbi:unnamed protein product [Candida verbasci]|uniref:WSC domain-containing protein n=1 Tax=Candida verbasci TaxID=1227364 RepID=A0A9W4TVB9_9ASCO|nr:unnamed protein product [Candida verbasci]